MVRRRSVIVTGAANGLGLAIAQRFIELSARVFLVDKEAIVQARVGRGQPHQSLKVLDSAI